MVGRGPLPKDRTVESRETYWQMLCMTHLFLFGNGPLPTTTLSYLSSRA